MLGPRHGLQVLRPVIGFVVVNMVDIGPCEKTTLVILFINYNMLKDTAVMVAWMIIPCTQHDISSMVISSAFPLKM